MKETRNPQINISKIPIGGGLGGAFAAAAAMLVILLGIPALWYFVGAAAVLGSGIALVLHFVRRKNTAEPWILPVAKK